MVSKIFLAVYITWVHGLLASSLKMTCHFTSRYVLISWCVHDKKSPLETQITPHPFPTSFLLGADKSRVRRRLPEGHLTFWIATYWLWPQWKLEGMRDTRCTYVLLAGAILSMSNCRYSTFATLRSWQLNEIKTWIIRIIPTSLSYSVKFKISPEVIDMNKLAYDFPKWAFCL